MNPLSPSASLHLSEREGVFVAGRGVKLFYRTHRVEGAPFRAVVAVIESPEDGGQLYAELVRLLAPSGYTLYGCTHGENRRVPGQTGFLEEWNGLYGELDSFIRLVGTHEPDAPLFLAGAQISGQLVMTYALHHPQKLRGVIAHQPRMHRSTARFSLVSLTRTLSRIWPAFMPSGIVDPAHEPDETVPEELPAASSVEGPIPQIAVTEATASEITIPVLVVDGETPVTRTEGGSDSQDAQVRHPSLLEVEQWLGRILKTMTG